jgi:isoleucyl-tRNA synthetase
VAGSIFGPKVKSLGTVLATLDASSVVPRLDAGETISLEVEGELVDLVKDYVITTIVAKKGFTMTVEDNLFVILDTTLTKELIDEGYAREYVSKVQQMRKNNGYEMMDRIKIYFDGDEEITEAVKLYESYIKKETLADYIEKIKDVSLEKQNLNGHETGLKLEKLL